MKALLECDLQGGLVSELTWGGGAFFASLLIIVPKQLANSRSGEPVCDTGGSRWKPELVWGSNNQFLEAGHDD